MAAPAAGVLVAGPTHALPPPLMTQPVVCDQPASLPPGGRVQRRQPAGRHSRHRLPRSVRLALVYGLPAVALVLEASAITRASSGTATQDAVNRAAPVVPAQPFTAASIPVCVEAADRLLQQDLVDMARGTSTSSAASRAAVGERFGVGSPLTSRIELAHQRLLRTAAADFLGRFNRNVDQELGAYRLRVRGACATP